MNGFVAAARDGYIASRLGPVYHIFVPEGGSWRWVATVPAPVTHEDAKRAMLVMGAVRRGQPIRMVLIDESPRPQPPPSLSRVDSD